MLHFVAARAVEDAVAKVDARRAAALHHQDLVGAHAEAPVTQRAQLRGIERQRLLRGIEHDEVVARALHLGEVKLHARIIPGSLRSPAATVTEISKATPRRPAVS